jgi:hypothetical protein
MGIIGVVMGLVAHLLYIVSTLGMRDGGQDEWLPSWLV